MNCPEEEMIELYIPVRSVFSMETPRVLPADDDDDRSDECEDENEDGFDDDTTLDEYEMGGRQPNEHDIMNYRLEEHRDEYNDDCTPCGQQQTRQNYRGRDDWNDRPAQQRQNQGRGDRYSEESEGCNEYPNDPKTADKGSKELQTYSMKKFTICDLLKSRQKNKKTRKAIQTLLDLKQTMGNRMNGSFFQRGGQGQKQGREIEYGGRCGRGGTKGNKEGKDEYEIFAMTLVPELKKLDDHQMRQFKWKVFQLIDEVSAESDSCGGGNEKRGGQQKGNQVDQCESDHSGSGMLYDEERRDGQDQSADQSKMQNDQCGDDNEQWSDQENCQPQQQKRSPCQQPRRKQNRQQQRQQYQQSQQYEDCEPQQRRQRQCGQRAPQSRQNCNPQTSYQQRSAPRQNCNQQTRQQHCGQEQHQHTHCPPPQSHQNCRPCYDPHRCCQPASNKQQCKDESQGQKQRQNESKGHNQSDNESKGQRQRQDESKSRKQNKDESKSRKQSSGDSKNRKQSKDSRRKSTRSSDYSKDSSYRSAESSSTLSDESFDTAERSPSPSRKKKGGKRVSYES
ncbi:hypothetical protein GE061_006128 [Apolygus lucorum]|uniref:BESS domain-containing protein n=1 Tax=Apolygus lucorum TaxID=248454 RepID=A0A8S9WSC1_APOLU|nr:hypothetical protein GE061_006128 [Apolygus lucorum]